MLTLSLVMLCLVIAVGSAWLISRWEDLEGDRPWRDSLEGAEDAPDDGRA